MINKIVLGLILLIIIIPNITHSEDMTNLFTPYGFNTPFLKSGEFIINATGGLNRSESETLSTDRPDYSSKTDYGYEYISTNGLLALTDKFLINTGFYLYPKQNKYYRNINKYTDYEYEYWYGWKTYIYPYIRLIYRPIQNLEISGYYHHYNPQERQGNIYNEQESTSNTNSNYSNISINVNYYGRFLGK